MEDQFLLTSALFSHYQQNYYDGKAIKTEPLMMEKWSTPQIKDIITVYNE